MQPRRQCDQPTSPGPDPRRVRTRDALPENPPPGTYVVVDVMHFSTTVVELLDGGAKAVHVPDRRGEELAFKRDNPEALLGGPKTDTYEPVDGYDFINSPSYVDDLEVADRPVSFTSSNGGRTVADLRERLESRGTVYIGTTTNARTLGRHLRAVDGPVYLVSAGTDGEPAIEDRVGADLIEHYLRGEPPTQWERQCYGKQLLVAREPGYATKNEVRNADVLQYELNFGSRDVIPRLDGDRLVDVANADCPSEHALGATART